MEFRIVGETHDHSTKVVNVMVTVEGAEGPTEESREFTFRGAARYKVDGNGKSWPKTGEDYKAEIEETLADEFAPKADSPSS